MYLQTNNGGSYFNIGYTGTLWSTNIATTIYAEGTNLFKIIAVNSNDVTNSMIVTNIVDNSAVIASITNTTSGVIIDGSYTFRGTNYDAWSTVTSTRIIITNAAGVVTNIQANIAGTTFNAAWNTATTNDGEYWAYANVTNDVGIGTNTPAYKVEITDTGTVGFEVESTSGNALIIADGHTGYSGIYYVQVAGTSKAIFSYSGVNDWFQFGVKGASWTYPFRIEVGATSDSMVII